MESRLHLGVDDKLNTLIKGEKVWKRAYTLEW